MFSGMLTLMGSGASLLAMAPVPDDTNTLNFIMVILTLIQIFLRLG